jgi:hypothetical protein
MYVSREAPDETEARLRRVIAIATLVSYDGTFVFDEFPLDAFPERARVDALALVRDDAVWSQLVPASVDASGERFVLWRFHFPPGVDNSGFVGWLATTIKRQVGTGVFVVCGQNSARGGIFDYWGAPEALRDQVWLVIDALRGTS